MKPLLMIAACSLLASCATPAPVSDLTLVIHGGTVYSGRDEPPVITDIWIKGDRIVAMGDLGPVGAVPAIDATGLAVAPGFIDIHSHAIRNSRERSGLINHPAAENYIRQGVTTAIGGPDGGSWVPLSTLWRELEAIPMAIHFGSFIGHNTIREIVMQRDDRSPTPAELEAMKEQVDQGMRDGAFGLSTGLKYMPGAFSETAEVIELARVAGFHGGIHISHLREEGKNLLDSVAETIRIGEEGNLPTQITHHKVVGAPMWGASRDSLALVDQARARGVDVSIDQYPYTASSTGLAILFPAWAQEGSREEQLARFDNPETRDRIHADVARNLVDDRGGNDPARVVLADCEWDASLNGLSLADILGTRGLEASIPNAATLAMELYRAGGCMTVFHAMNEEDVMRIMRHAQTMIASDGGIHVPGEGVPHPRNYGAFARVLEYYVRNTNTLPLHSAIHKMSLMPAQRIGLADRGRIAVGAIADIAIFDPEDITENTTFQDPHRYAGGMSHVLVAGELVLRNGAMTGARPGRILKSTD